MINLYIGTKFLGHDSAAFIIDINNKEVFGMTEERLTRFKHDSLEPIDILNRYLEYKDISIDEISNIYIAHSFKEQTENKKLNLYKYEMQGLLRKYFNEKYIKEYQLKVQKYKQSNVLFKLYAKLTNKPLFLYTLKSKFLHRRVSYQEYIRYYIEKTFPYSSVKVEFFNHQLSHNIAAYYSSPYEECIGISFDGEGDFEFSSVYSFCKGDVKKLYASKALALKTDILSYGFPLKFRSSIGNFYSVFTWLLGFTPIADEGKVEALAAFGKWNNRVYDDLNSCVSINEEQVSIEINSDIAESIFKYKNLQNYLKIYTKEDIAAAVQKFLEDVVTEYVRLVINKTKVDKIVLSGGVSANVIMNLAIFEQVTKNIFIVPAMADDGTAQGAAILTLLENGYHYEDLKWLKEISMPYWGTSYEKDEILKILKKYNSLITYTELGSNWPEETAKMLVNGKIGAIFHGRMEWGPRALGNRSIIADVRNKNIHTIINKEIKNRPLFQPFCPSILAEEKDRLFRSVSLNKHMTTACRIKEQFKSLLPGAVHIDGTARAQFVEKQDNPNYYRLIKKVKELTGYGVIINTSFNKHGRTIVESIDDAVIDFIDTNMDYLVIEGILVTRK